MTEILEPKSWVEVGGLAGLVIAVLFVFLWNTLREHRQERKEDRKAYLESQEKMNAAMTEAVNKLGDAVTKNTIAIKSKNQ